MGVKWYFIRVVAYLVLMLFCCAVGAALGFPVDGELVK
jgi:hypothetical protein